MKKKILIDARMYGLENTGIGRYLVNLIEELQKIKTSDLEFILLLKSKYFNRIKLKRGWKKVKADISHYTFEEQVKLPGIINKQQPDLVHFPHFNMPVFWTGKFITTIHDMTMHKQKRDASKLPLPIYLFKRLPYKFTFRKAVKYSLKIITPSDVVKNELTDYFQIENNKVKTVYEGIDKVYFNRSKSNVKEKYNIKNDYFLHVGNVYPHKNVESAIDALITVNKKTSKNINIVISCSRNEFSKKLNNIIRQKRAQKVVKMLGFVQDKDLVVFHKNSLAYVYPSFAEGFGLQGLESMASGTLLIASDIPIFKEIYQDQAIYFNPGNIESITEAMEKIINLSQSDRKDMITRNKAFVKKYSWNKMAQETLNIYNSVLK
jgi:glycosyltransferase involved in cell wall biosynthesis